MQVLRVSQRHSFRIFSELVLITTSDDATEFLFSTRLISFLALAILWLCCLVALIGEVYFVVIQRLYASLVPDVVTFTLRFYVLIEH